MIQDIEYGNYQGGNQVSFDNNMIKEWLKNILIDTSNQSINDSYGLVEALLFEGEYMPFISRNGNIEFVGRDWIGFPTQHLKPVYKLLNIKGDKNKIYLNDKDVTEKLRIRYNKFLNLCKELQEKNELGAIWYHWKGEKL